MHMSKKKYLIDFGENNTVLYWGIDIFELVGMGAYISPTQTPYWQEQHNPVHADSEVSWHSSTKFASK